MRTLCLPRLLAVLALLAPLLRAAPLEKWVYCQTNLQVPAQVAALEQLLRRAQAAGYDHMLLADSKFARLGHVTPQYFEHVRRIRAVAAELHVDVVPAVFPIGYSNDLLSLDPNLAEGLPVKDALFVVQGGVARAVTEPPAQLANGDFSRIGRGNGWNLPDACVQLVDGAVHLKDPAGANARIMQPLRLNPFREYHLALRVKSAEFAGPLEVKVIAARGAQLNYANLGVRKTQDWTVHHIVFNSLQFTDATLYIGAWGAKTGEVWIDDVTLEEAGLVNLVRRPGCPLVVRTEDGATLAERRDFEPVRDPALGMRPYGGSYDVWHEPPALRVARPDGTRLRVSYFHAVTIYDGQVCACPSEPATIALLRDQAQRMQAAWQPAGFMMSHDEWRVLNWCDACQQRHLDAGAIVADNARACLAILHDVAPRARVYAWNDMFDPQHNARDNYYLVRGNLVGAWEGLGRDVIIFNWNLRKLPESLPFFAARGHRQIIAGYYDARVDRLREHLAAAKNVPGVIGVMYTTWKRNYADLEAFARIADEGSGAPSP